MIKYLLYAAKIVLAIFGTDLPIDSTIIDVLDQVLDTLLDHGHYFKQLAQLLKIRIKCWWRSKQHRR